ncbi:MAG: hypothetical protein IH626_17495 [Rhodospirillales bacterium]|nr:hypothetical protein [Rhodospirillales bacterium]
MRIPGADQAIGNLIKWSAKDEWTPYLDQVFADHFDFIKEQFEITGEDLVDLLGDAFSMVYGVVLEDFFAARFGEEGELNVVDDYLKRRGWREKVPARRYLEALRGSVLSLYEVVDLAPGHSMTVRNLILGGDPVTVEEKLGSESAARWDRIAGRLVTVNNKPYFTGGLLLFPQRVASEVLSAFDDMTKRLRTKLRREAKKQGEPAEIDDHDVRVMILDTMAPCLFTQAWLIDTLDRAFAPIPEIRNTDGDEIVFSEVRFPIKGDEAKVAAVLDGIVGFERDEPDASRWTWHDRGSPSQRMSQNRQEGLTYRSENEAGRISLGNAEIAGNALILTTNSRERAERARDLLACHLGALAGSPLTSHQDLEKMLEKRPGSTPTELDLPPEAAEQVLHTYLDDHYRRTLDDPIPLLDGKAPRQAVKTKKGRAQVVDWLKQLENSEFRRAAGQGHKPYDTAWMWRELKIREPR